MRIRHLVVLGAVCVALSLQTASADGCGPGGIYWCESEVYYDSNTRTIEGYSLTWDYYYDGNRMRVSATFLAPDGTYPYEPGTPDNPLAYEDFGEPYVAFSLVQPGPGPWEVRGSHYEGVWNPDAGEYFWTDLGTDYGTAFPSWAPEGEDTYWTSTGDGYRALYQVYIEPSDNWTGLLFETSDWWEDVCYYYSRSGEPVIPDFGPGANISGGVFYDWVGQSNHTWANVYNRMIYNQVLRDEDNNPVSACGFMVHIYDDFNYGIYYAHYSSTWLDGASVTADRDGIPVVTPWVYPGQ